MEIKNKKTSRFARNDGIEKRKDVGWDKRKFCFTCNAIDNIGPMGRLTDWTSEQANSE